MSVDVRVAQTIDCPVDIVAGYAADPSNVPKWYRRIHSVDWKTNPPVAIGSRVAFEARFMGKQRSIPNWGNWGSSSPCFRNSWASPSSPSSGNCNKPGPFTPDDLKGRLPEAKA